MCAVQYTVYIVHVHLLYMYIYMCIALHLYMCLRVIRLTVCGCIALPIISEHMVVLSI